MDLDQYFEEAMPQNYYFEDKLSPEMWESADDTIADSDRNGGFDCNICLESVQDPVVTLCGHLYCWPCIYKWLNFYSFTSQNEENEKTECPVCKSEISESSLVPLYAHGQTTSHSTSKTRRAGIIIPRRPHGPSWMAGSSRSRPASQVYDRHYRNHPEEFNSFPGSYTSPMFDTGTPLTNTFDTTYGVFGEMIYSRVFGHQVTNTYTNSYNLSLESNPRIRRQLVELDKSLSRICVFLLCCMVLCLLLF